MRRETHKSREIHKELLNISSVQVEIVHPLTGYDCPYNGRIVSYQTVHLGKVVTCTEITTSKSSFLMAPRGQGSWLIQEAANFNPGKCSMCSTQLGLGEIHGPNRERLFTAS